MNSPYAALAPTPALQKPTKVGTLRSPFASLPQRPSVELSKSSPPRKQVTVFINPDIAIYDSGAFYNWELDWRRERGFRYSLYFSVDPFYRIRGEPPAWLRRIIDGEISCGSWSIDGMEYPYRLIIHRWSDFARFSSYYGANNFICFSDPCDSRFMQMILWSKGHPIATFRKMVTASISGIATGWFAVQHGAHLFASIWNF